jgi:hypothetical protein
MLWCTSTSRIRDLGLGEKGEILRISVLYAIEKMRYTLYDYVYRLTSSFYTAFRLEEEADDDTFTSNISSIKTLTRGFLKQPPLSHWVVWIRILLQHERLMMQKFSS